MREGFQEIPWLTDEERNLFKDFARIVGCGGYATSNYRTSKVFSYFWIANSVLMCFTLLCSTLHFIDRLEMVAYCLHHSVLMLDDFIVVYVFWNKRDGILTILEHSSWSYNYNSNIVEAYSKVLIRQRMTLLRIIRNCIILSGVFIFFEVQVFYILEVVFFQTYQTIYPLYFGMDLNWRPIYFATVVVQETLVFLTTVMGMGAVALVFTVWAHLIIEIKILKFAVENVTEIVKERIDSTGERTDDAMNDYYRLYCYHFAKHHASIFQFFNEFKNIASWITTTVFATGFLIMVAVGLTLLSDNMSIKLKLFGFLIAQLGVIYGWCWVGQAISDEGAEISEAIVSIEWWLMPKSCATTLHLIMVGCRIPLAMTTPFGPIANNECCMDMLSGAYQMVNLVYQSTHRS